jgi:hypothetical protein
MAEVQVTESETNVEQGMDVGQGMDVAQGTKVVWGPSVALEEAPEPSYPS